MQTRLTVRALSCDAKVIGDLVGGCRVTVRRSDTGALLAQGLQQGSTGNTDEIMRQPRVRGQRILDGAAAFVADLDLETATPVTIVAEGPLAYPHAAQQASVSTWLIPGRAVEGDGVVVTLYGSIVEILRPCAVESLRGGDRLLVEVGVRLL